MYMVMTFGTFSASRKNSLIKVSIRSCGTSARIRIDHRSQCASYGYLAAARGELLRRAGRHQEARTALKEAALLTGNDVERALLADRLASLDG